MALRTATDETGATETYPIGHEPGLHASLEEIRAELRRDAIRRGAAARARRRQRLLVRWGA